MANQSAAFCSASGCCGKDMDTKEDYPLPLLPTDRTYRLDLKHCIMNRCDGELAELSYYERNNWATFELQCNQCRKKFVVKVEL